MRHGSIVAGPRCYHNLRLIDLRGYRNEDGRFVAPKRVAGGGRPVISPRLDGLCRAFEGEVAQAGAELHLAFVLGERGAGREEDLRHDRL